jgi:hypothetical protein
MPVNMKIRRPVLALLLLIPAVSVLLILTRPWDTLAKGVKRVALGSTDEVDRIVLEDPYHTTELTKAEGTWYLFGTEHVNPVSVENLLIAAGRLEVTSVTENGAPDEAAGSGGEVTGITYYRDDMVLLNYSLETYSGRYLLHLSGSEEAYYVSLPGYPGLELDRVFSANPDHYREHLLIDLRPSEISEISVELASGESFRFIQDREGDISCEPENEHTRLPGESPDELAVRLLFSYFTSIRYERPAGISSDSLSGAAAQEWKLATIRVRSFSGEHHSLQVYEYHEKPGADPDLFRALVLYDNEPDVLIMNYIYLDVLMRGISHYFGEK